MESVPDLRASEFEEEIDEDAFEEIVSPTTTQFESLNLIESTEFSKNCNSIKEEDESELTESRHSLNQTTHVHQQYNYDIDDIIQFPSSMDQLLTITESKIMNDSSSELHKILDQVDALKKQISNIQSELDISKQLQMDQNAHHSNDLINLRQLFDASTAQQLLDFQILSKQKADNTAPLLLQLNEILDTIVSKAQIQHLQKESTRVASELLLLEGNIGQDNKCMDEIVKEMNTASRVLKSSPFHRAYDESDSLSSLYGAHLRALNVLITCWKENIERIGDIEGDVSSNGSVSTPVEENEIDYNQSSQNESYYSSKNDKEKITMSAPGIERSLLKEAAV